MEFKINTKILRNLDLNSLVKAYSDYMYNTNEDLTNDLNIRNNLDVLLDWDKSGDLGLGFYCSHLESIKSKDWEYLINFIKNMTVDIKEIRESSQHLDLEQKKHILANYRGNRKTKLGLADYEPSNRGYKAVPVEYKGVQYKSKAECMFKNNITYYELSKYLSKREG